MKPIKSDVKEWVVIINDTEDQGGGLNATIGPFGDYQEANRQGEAYVKWLHEEYGLVPPSREWEYHVSPLRTSVQAMQEEQEYIKEEKAATQ